MKGSGILTMLMLMTLAVFAYAEASPRPGRGESAGLFSRTASKSQCALGSHYSSFYGKCTRTWAPTAS